MPNFDAELHIDNIGSRNDIRMRVVDIFSTEQPGHGKGELASKYTYYVETLNHNRRIYLKRPANLHNGFDFVVCVEGVNFNREGRIRNNPTHDDILFDLEAKYHENPEIYLDLYDVLEKVYYCEYVDYSILDSLYFDSGFPCDLIVKTLKWLFIEQDIRYWNYSGRDMLWNGIYSINH